MVMGFSLGLASWVYMFAIIGLASALALLIIRRYQALQRYSFPPITSVELRQRLLHGHELLLLDLRHELDRLAHPYIIPGAVRVSPKQLGSGWLQEPAPRPISRLLLHLPHRVQPDAHGTSSSGPEVHARTAPRERTASMGG